MASGSKAAFKKADAVLKAIAVKVYELGEEAGTGSKVKMINQLLAGVHIAASAEAMALAIRVGADPKVVYEVISNSAGSSWMFIVELAADFRKVTTGLSERDSASRLHAIEFNRLHRQIGRGGNLE